MTAPGLTDARWSSLLGCSNEFTCYSAAMATWLAITDDDWAGAINPALWLRLTEEDGALFGFGYFPPALRARLGLRRVGADTAEDAVDGVLAELERSQRVIVAADGYHLPWHVAHGRVHAPHWFILLGRPDRLEIADPFACRNELGTQTAERRFVDPDALRPLLTALPGTDPVHRLREVMAFGDRTDEALGDRFQWFVHAEVEHTTPPRGVDGPEALRLLAAHFRVRGQDPDAYRQVDDIWSIARHRAFNLSVAKDRAQADAGLAPWVAEHGEPLVKRWGHIAPLLMQARLSLAAGRAASASVPDTLDELATRERAAAAAFPPHVALASISRTSGA